MFQTRRYDNAKDEYYTTAEEVKYIFTQILDIEQLKDKIVYCPCDSEASEFTKWLEAHKDEYKLKELIHTSDDFNTHEDIFEKADIIITNPPFSKIYTELFPLIKKHNDNYFLFGSLNRIHQFIREEDARFIRHPHFRFITPFINRNTNDYFTEVCGVIYITNLKFTRPSGNIHKFLNKRAEDITLKTENYLAIDKTVDFPYDYDDYVLVPVSFLLNYNIDQFEIKDHDKKTFTFNDGRGRYKRFLARRKPEFVGQKL